MRSTHPSAAPRALAVAVAFVFSVGCGGPSAAPTTGDAGPAEDAGKPGGGPIIVALSANVATLTPGATLVVTALVRGDDLIGGRLQATSGNTYGPFDAATGKGAYALTLTWNQISAVDAIDAPAGGVARTLTAEFFDSLGRKTAGQLEVRLVCPQPELGLCGGACTDFASDPMNCGACRRASPAAGTCAQGKPACLPPRTLCGGACVDVRTSLSDCGACGRAVPMGASCQAGAIVCTDPLLTACGSTCVDLKHDVQHCGSCTNDCRAWVASVGGTAQAHPLCRSHAWPGAPPPRCLDWETQQYAGSCSGTACSVTPAPRTCRQICGAVGLACANSSESCGNSSGFVGCWGFQATGFSCTGSEVATGCDDAPPSGRTCYQATGSRQGWLTGGYCNCG